jgi:hypothetical protein
MTRAYRRSHPSLQGSGVRKQRALPWNPGKLDGDLDGLSDAARHVAAGVSFLTHGGRLRQQESC